ncbi:DUF1559 domain-containing protein [bacterium]|nr:DUF1559 domain-containing protein [bacterium]
MGDETTPPKGQSLNTVSEDNGVTDRRSSSNRGCLRFGCLVAFGGFLLVTVASGLSVVILPLFELPWRLATGWWSFLRRWQTAGGSIVWSDVVFAAALVLILIVGGHSSARWIARSRGFDRWKLHSTARSVVAVLMVSVAGIALLGVAHQVFWMATSQSRMTHSTGHEIRGRMQAGNYLRGIALALHEHNGVHLEFPPGGTFRADGTPMHSWVTLLLPLWHEETGGLADRIDLHSPWTSDVNRPAMQQSVPLLNVHSQGPAHTADGYATSHFAANSYVFRPNLAFTEHDVSDGLANTIFLGDVRFRHKAWGDPTNTRDPALGVNRSADGFGSNFAGGTHFLMGDGSVRFLSDRTAPEVLQAMATPDGGEDVDVNARPHRLRNPK